MQTAGSGRQHRAADLILTNARILTMTPTMTRAEALAIAGDRIIGVGTVAQVAALAGPDTRTLNARGRSVLPGFVESHLHLGLGGAELGHLHVHGVQGIAALRNAVAAFGDHHPDRPVLIGQGADYTMVGHPMTRHDLDKVSPDRPLALMASDHHTVWANTAALRASGLLRGATLPPGHVVVMGADGLATGELREFEAFAPVMALAGEARLNLGIATGAEPVPPPSPADRAADMDKIAAGLAHCARHGITSMVTMDGNRYTLDLLRDLQMQGRLTARVRVPFHFKPHMDLPDLDRATTMTRDFADDWLGCGFVKLFMDGVIDSRTAAMVHDYADAPGHRGDLLFPPDRFAAIATEIDRRGLQIAVHAIGDAAVRNTIDGYAAARAANGPRDSRHRIEHIELIDRADIARLGALGITASLQPPHPPGAMDFPVQPTLDRIGRARWPDAYLWRTLGDAGAALAFASDWPVTDVSVLRGIQAALTRVPYDGAADERLGLMETLHAYTAGGAWAAHRDHLTGRLAPGLAADVVMLDGDIEATTPGAIGAMSVALTICGGRITHQG
jgi:predicted amidohydrolase YtcJ